MIDTSLQKIQINQVVHSQLPSFVQEENPLFVDFLKTYYSGQEYRGGNIDIVQNLNEYQKVETFSGNENLIGFTTCTSDVTFYDSTINVVSTDGWPEKYGLLKINDEIISYTGKTDTTFTGCIRGFSGVESLHHSSDPDQLVFSESSSSSHKNQTQVINLSNLFLQEFWKKTKEQFLPGFEDRKVTNELDKSNFLRQARDLYSSKGTDDAISILFRALFAKSVEVIKPIEYLIAPSDADYVVGNDIVVEAISGDPSKIIGQTLRQTGDDFSSAAIFNVIRNQKNGREYYVISLGKISVKGNFEVTGGTALTNNVSIGATVLTVDSTLGFPESGSFYVGAGITVGIATYSSKSSTQFFGVTGISSSYQAGQFVRSSNTVYSYEDGDIKKPVIMRMTAVARTSALSNASFLYPGDILKGKNIGNYTLASNYRLNSWIHNIKTTSNVAKDTATNTSNVDIVTNTINTIDPHLLKLGDPVSLLDISSAIPQNVEGTVSSVISPNSFQITITTGTLSVNRAYKVRLNTIFASSNNSSIKVNNFVSNVQNTYTDKLNENVYVAAGSLPAYKIYATTNKKTFGFASVANNSITINNHGFITGDLVKYKPVGVGESSISGLSTDSNYAVTKIDDNTIKLSQSISDAAVKRFLTFNSTGSALTHEIIPSELAGKQVKHQNFLRKFPIYPSLNEYTKELQNESIGMFRNGVEIVSNRSGDSIWYGVIKNVEVRNGGSGYDVLYPPNINISDSVGTGATTYAIVENGKFEAIEVISGGYDIRNIPQIKITGGNGSGATAVPRLKETYTERSFNADLDVNTSTDTVTFDNRHLFDNGESVYYRKSQGFAPIGGLVDNSLYYLHVVNDFSVKFMSSYEDAVAGINTINLTSRAAGTNTLKSTKVRKVVDSIVITNKGSGYSNRKAVVTNSQYPPSDYTTVNDVNSGINTSNNFVYFKNHGFKDGDFVEYKSSGPISGLSTTQNYYVLRLDEDRFRLSSAGIGTTTTRQNYNRKDYVKFNDSGSSTHTFKYPDIHVDIESISGVTSAYSYPRLRPVCHGNIVQCPVTSVGTGYGSTDTINVHRRPDVTVSNGSRGLIDIVISEGKIIRAFIKDGGGGYATPPTIEVRGDGRFAKIVSTVTNGVITSVSIVDSGKDYTPEKTTVAVIPSGAGAKIIANVSRWDVDLLSKYRDRIDENDDGIIVPSQNELYGLKYVHAYASRKLRLVLEDNIEDDFSESSSVTHSPILGWAYDGSPIYGPYGYGSAIGGAVRRMVPSYTLVSKGNRPPTSVYPLGYFVDDYVYTADGDLDEFNGRFCKTPEFPDGVYAYFCTIEATNSSQSPFVNTREPLFPYILNGFKYKKDEFNSDPGSIQTDDILNSGELVRNTYYYKFGASNSNYDYLTTNQLSDTQLIVRSTKPTGIHTVTIILPGEKYKVNDRVKFNNLNSGGNGATAKIKTLVGKGLSTFNYSTKIVPNVSFQYRDSVVTGIATTAHGLRDKDLVVVSGISTGELKFIEGPHTISVSSVTARLEETLDIPSVTGVTTTIKLEVSGVSQQIEVDDTIGIGTERLTVIDVNKTFNLYRVRREIGFAKTHPAGLSVSVDPRTFNYSVGVQTTLTTRLNRKIVFNPQSTIGFGTAETIQSVVGVGTTVIVRVKATDGTILNDHELPPSASTADNAISIINHGLKTGQKLVYGAGPTGAALTVSNNLDLSNPFQLVEGQFVYAVKKSNDLLGITTTIAGIGTTTTSLYFKVIGDGTEHTFTETNKGYVGHVERHDVSVRVVQNHTLKTGDKVKIDLLPNTTVTKFVEYDTISRKTLVDGYYVSAASTFVGVGATNSLITITAHGWDDGDKVLYKSGTTDITPLTDRGEYFIQKINDNQFRLSTNYSDATRFGGTYIGITSFGSGVHKFSRINPHIVATRGQTVGFAVSDGTLQDLKLEFYEDENFVTRYDGFGISTEVTRSGTPGVSGAVVNLKLTNNVPSPLYYKLTPINLDTIDVSKRDTSPDNTVNSGSKIIIENSVYSGTQSITTTTVDRFTYQTIKKPEAPLYTSSSGISTFKYVTDSLNASGGIHEVDINFAGIGYLRNPGVSTITTLVGENGLLRLYDDSVGKVGEIEMLKIGYEYPSDKTVQPSVDLPVVVTVSNNFILDQVGVVTAGRNYVSPPDLIVPDRSDVELTAELSGTSVGNVTVDVVGRGFNEVPNPPRIIAVRNTNGIGIVSTSSNGVTNFVTLSQPTNGWRLDGSDFPFAVGDKIFVEGVGTAQTTFATKGGYNSENYDYTFFTVATRNPAGSQITYSIAGLGTTGGTFDPDTSAGRVIKQGDLPTFSALLTPEPFYFGEPVTYGSNGRAFVLDNEGYNPVTNTLRLRSLTTELKNGDVIKGRLSGAEGTVRNVQSFEDFFVTDFYSERSKGWQKETGKLNNDFQKLEDSNYYQNFSYSLKSEVPLDTWKSAVDSIVHPTGYKNFSDLVVNSQSVVGFARSRDLRVSESTPPGVANLNVNIDSVKSFYVRDDFDIGGEEVLSNGQSKFVTFKNKKIATFINIISNKVDLIDDISPQFTGIGTTTSALVVGLSSFRLTTNGNTLFTKVFNPSDTGVVSVGSSVFRINNHNFQTGERIKYDPGNGVYGANRIDISTSNVVLGGVSTDKMPAELFAIKLNNNFFSVAGLATAAERGEALTFQGAGSGTSHSFDVLRPDDRVLIEVDEIIQSPLFKRRVDVQLAEAVGVASTTIKVVGVTSITVNNLINIDNEILEVKNVGFGSTNVLRVERGVLGSVAAAHTVGAACTMRGGSFHIVKDVIYFTTPPYGLTGISTFSPGIGTQSTFNGRVFNRKNPTTNFIFDDLSQDFTGIGKTFTLLQDNADVTGIVTTISGPEVVNNGIVLINNIPQRPTVDFNITERLDPGIGASIFFAGDDRESLPRGGIINEFSIGIGSGYQPLVAAAATAIVNGAGAIESVVVTGGGSGYRSGPVPIQVLNPLGIGSTAILQGTIGAAGTVTGITTISGGSGYASTNPPIIVVGVDTGYSNLKYTGGTGNGFRASVVVGTGGSIIDFRVVDSGIGYKNGEVLTVAGIPTDPAVGAGFSAHTITVKSITFDKFAGYSFGQLLPLDDFSSLFNGSRTTFTLTITTTTKDIININSDDTSVEPGNNLLVFLNDVLQQPGQSYEFNGGTQISFAEPPKAGSKLQILFFRGSNEDVDDGNPFPTIKTGDQVQLQRQGNYLQQKERRVTEIAGVKKVETNLYNGVGINQNPSFERSVSWIKQTSDLILNNQALPKSRISLTANIYPAANIIQNVGVNSQSIYVDNAYPFFSAFDNRSTPNEVPGTGIELIKANFVDRADATASVSAGGTVFNPIVTDPGAGYLTVPTVSVASTVTQIREIGKVWTNRSSYSDIEYQSISRNVYGVFVAVGSTTGINTSTDGVTWFDSGNSTSFGDLTGVVGMNTHTVIVGASGTVGYSTDGRTYQPSKIFTRRNVFPITFFDDVTISQNFNDVTFGRSVGVAVGAAGTIAFTRAGQAGFGTAFELTQKVSSVNLNGVGSNDNVFVAVGENGIILRSNNGESWSGVTTSTITTNLNHAHYGNGQWIAVGAAGTIIRSSDNGLSWSVVSAGATFDLTRVGYANSVWVAIGQSGMVLNSVDTNTWYKKFVGVGTDFNGLAFGDNKFVAVGLSSSIYSSEFATVSAAGTATVSAAGTITAITINESGFGYNPNSPVEVLISVEPVTRETVTSVNVEGDYGNVVSVASSATGISTTSPMLIFELDSDSFLDQAAFGNITKSGIGAGDYFVITNSVTGAPTTSITIGNQPIGVGTTFLDNIYLVAQREQSNSGIVTVYCNVQGITGIGTTDFAPRIGKYSWGRLYSFQRDRLNPRSFTAETNNGSVGISTGASVVRIKSVSENYSDLDQTT